VKRTVWALLQQPPDGGMWEAQISGWPDILREHAISFDAARKRIETVAQAAADQWQALGRRVPDSVLPSPIGWTHAVEIQVEVEA
jgi:hypothetical protein